MLIEKLLLQHRAVQPDNIVQHLASCVKHVKPTHAEIAVAYASVQGCHYLIDSIGTEFGNVRKRWLVSLDLGRTEPRAIRLLKEMPQSEVRIPNGSQIIQSNSLIPERFFHPKLYGFRRLVNRKIEALGLIVGSGNLTGAGLVSNVECVWTRIWTSPFSKPEQSSLTEGLSYVPWFDSCWEQATEMEEIIDDYDSLFTQTGDKHGIVSIEPLLPRDERLFSSANRFWIQVGKLYRNRGPQKPGNQVDLPQGSRYFFGFQEKVVEPNYIFGTISIQCKGYSPVPRNMRFGANQMDKINLPIPGKDGPSNYDNSVLLFERSGTVGGGRPNFTLSVLSNHQLQRIIEKASLSQSFAMASGRQYGLLF